MILVGGENLIDLVQIDEKDGLPVYQAVPGGSPFNVAIAAGRQGAQVQYLTPISTDNSGDMLAARLRQSGVTLAAERNSAPSSLAMVTLDDGVPSYSFYRDGTAERKISNAALHAALSAEVELFHIGSLALIDGEDADLWVRFAAQSKTKGVAISLDPNVRPSLIVDPQEYRTRLFEMIQLADIIKLSDEDLRWLYEGRSEQDSCNQLAQTCNAAVLVLTKGEKGSVVLHEGSWHDCPVVPVSEIKDTVGAGDTFMATMLVWLGRRGFVRQLPLLSLENKLAMINHATHAAAINCGRQGCDPPHLADLPPDGN